MGDNAFFVLCVTVSFVTHGLEAMYGRAQLRRYLLREGWTVDRLRWRPTWPLRQVRFAVEAARNGEEVQGVALVGGRWTGPVLSRRIDFDWESSPQPRPVDG